MSRFEIILLVTVNLLSISEYLLYKFSVKAIKHDLAESICTANSYKVLLIQKTGECKQKEAEIKDLRNNDYKKRFDFQKQKNQRLQLRNKKLLKELLELKGEKNGKNDR